MPRTHAPIHVARSPVAVWRHGHPPRSRGIGAALRQRALLAALLALTGIPAAWAQNVDGPQPKMFGGRVASFRDNPWQVSISPAGRPQHVCGGVLVHERWVLTAAHCLDTLGSENAMVRAGDDRLNGDRMSDSPVRVAKRYPDYDRHNKRHDIALLRIEPLPAGANARPIRGASQAVLAQLARLRVWATGWGINRPHGYVASNELQAAEFRVVPNDVCSQAQGYGGRITLDMLCLGGTGEGQSICDGDSGGPAVVRVDGTAYLVGLSSMALKGCAGREAFSVFTRVDRYADWVNLVTSGEVRWR